MSRALALCLLAACGSSSSPTSVDGAAPPADGTAAPDSGSGSGSGRGSGSGSAAARTIIVIPLENKSSAQIYGNVDAPYINGLLPTSASASNFQDELPALPSEPHYIWMEAGTNAFSDYTFTTDADASAANSTASTAHLSTQLTAAGRTWTAYQEDMTAGTCPIASVAEYAAKHAPFVFFQDVSGSPPSATTAGCEAHYKPLAQVATDLAADALPNYVFITPNLCHEMHGAAACPSGTGTAANIEAGDTWLQTNLPPFIAYTHTHDAVIFLVWDEGDSSNKIPFIAIGDHVVPGVSAITYTHGSLLKTEEELLGLPFLPTTSPATVHDLGAMFEAGYQ